jgi:hypothetical protein
MGVMSPINRIHHLLTPASKQALANRDKKAAVKAANQAAISGSMATVSACCAVVSLLSGSDEQAARDAESALKW